MKTTVLMAAIVAGFGLAGTGAQAQERPDFATLDANGDGQITMEELEAQGEQRFTDADTDGNGALSEAELLAKASERSEGRAAEMVARMLERLDENEDGEIQQSELPERDGDRTDRRFERADADEDGTISEDEFEAAGERDRGGRRGHRSGKGGEHGSRGGRG
jgi:Ca2+-binding EF-hand superfamily protein